MALKRSVSLSSSSSDEIEPLRLVAKRAKIAPDDEKLSEVSPTRAKHSVVNMMTKAQIDQVMEQVFCTKYMQTKGKPKQERLKYKVNYVFHIGDEYWANPYAFSATKSHGVGYPTLPFKLDSAHKSTNGKSTWVARLPIHLVVWRWYNQYAAIPPNQEVSHIGDDCWLITPHRLCVESGCVNRARSACLEQGWHKQFRHGTVRCPHTPVCDDPARRPPDDVFRDGSCEPPGLPVRNTQA